MTTEQTGAERIAAAKFTFRRDGSVEYDGVKIGRVTVKYIQRVGFKTFYGEYTGWGPTGKQMTTCNYHRRADVADLLLSVYQARQRQWTIDKLREIYGETANDR